MVNAKCAECGLLAVQRMYTRGLEPADKYFREHSHIHHGPQIDFTTRFEDMPICAGAVRDFEGIVERQFQGGQDKLVSLESLLREGFDCPEFVKWRPGLSIEAHHQMIDRERALQREERQDKEIREWQARESASSRRYRIAELVLVIVTIIAVLVAAFIERGGQPIINNYITPSTSGTEVPQP